MPTKRRIKSKVNQKQSQKQQIHIHIDNSKKTTRARLNSGNKSTSSFRPSVQYISVPQYIPQQNPAPYSDITNVDKIVQRIDNLEKGYTLGENPSTSYLQNSGVTHIPSIAKATEPEPEPVPVPTQSSSQYLKFRDFDALPKSEQYTQINDLINSNNWVGYDDILNSAQNNRKKLKKAYRGILKDKLTANEINSLNFDT